MAITPTNVVRLPEREGLTCSLSWVPARLGPRIFHLSGKLWGGVVSIMQSSGALQE